MKRFLVLVSVFLTIAVALAATAALFPWKSWLESRLETALKEKGFGDATLSVASIGSRGIVLEELTFGSATPLRFGNIAIDYSLSGLREKKVQGITLEGFTLEAIRSDGRWIVKGLEEYLSGRKTGSPITLPVTMDDLSRIPFDTVTVEESLFNLQAPGWQAELPVTLQLDKLPVPRMVLQSESVRAKKGKVDILTGSLKADIALVAAERKWTGKWTIDSVTLAGTPSPVPPLAGDGIVTAFEDHIVTEGRLQSGDNAYHIAFTYDLAMNASRTSSLTVNSAAMPWKEGRLSIGAVDIPLSGRKSISLRLNVRDVSVGELIGAMTGQRVSATGTVSGEVPLTVGKNGTLIFHGGNLTAESPGTITMPPEVIPGDNEQIALVRDILKDFRYTDLSVGFNSDENKALSILLSLAGSNPAVYNGREVKLNVNLTGDLLEFVKQNIMFLSNPETLLEAGNNAEN